jgi:hypothetical protein
MFVKGFLIADLTDTTFLAQSIEAVQIRCSRAKGGDRSMALPVGKCQVGDLAHARRSPRLASTLWFQRNRVFRGESKLPGLLMSNILGAVDQWMRAWFVVRLQLSRHESSVSLYLGHYSGLRASGVTTLFFYLNIKYVKYGLKKRSRA